MNIRKHISKRALVASKIVLTCIQEKTVTQLHEDLGICWVVGVMEGEGTYLLNILSSRCTEPGRVLFDLGGSVTTLNPNQTT